MPILRSTRHEAFCQALAKGMTASAAYVAATVIAVIDAVEPN